MNGTFLESLFPGISDSKRINYVDLSAHTQYVGLDELIEKILTRHRLYVAELEAKVYTYEKIIANSNFAPILKESKNKKGNLGADGTIKVVK